MHFVQDLGKGILGKPDSIELWEEIIANIPDADLMYKGQNFLFPAIGHGTEVKVMAKRLGTLGWSKSQIVEHFYLCDKYSVFTNVAKAQGFKHVHTGSFIDWELDMKFDVVLGNPPYQDPTATSSKKLWTQFLKMSMGKLVDNGHLLFVTPASWMTPGNELLNLFSTNDTLYVNLDSKKYFQNVGTSISAYVIRNSKTNVKTQFIADNKTVPVSLTPNVMLPKNVNNTTLSILDKILANKTKLDFRNDSICHSQRTDKVSAKQDDVFIHPVKHGSESLLYSATKHPLADKKKVLFYMSGAMKPVYDNGVYGISQHQGCVLVNNKNEAEVLISYLKSPIFKFILTSFSYYQAWIKPVLKNMPGLDLTRSWTDAELYAHFNLTQEEIEYVESTVK